MFERVVVVTKRTALEELLLRHHSRSQARFFIERRGSSFEEYEAAEAVYRASLERTLAAVPRELPRETISRELIPGFLFRPTDLVIALGPDGLCVNVAKYLEGQPILAVNPDPKRIDGVLMRFRPEEVEGAVRRMRQGEFRTETLTLAKAATNDGQTLYAVNDFLIGRRDHVSSRYALTFGGRTERQSSSGILIATGVGSSGWMKSVVTGAAALIGEPGGPKLPFAWNDRRLFFAVREPFASRSTGATMVCGWIEAGLTLLAASEMSEGGAIFSDGVIEDAVEFNAGTIVTVSAAEKSAILVAH